MTSRTYRAVWRNAWGLHVSERDSSPVLLSLRPSPHGRSQGVVPRQVGSPSPDWSSIAVGALRGVSALAVGELVAALWPGARSPVAGLGRAVIDATPGPAIDIGVALIGERDKPLMTAALAGVFAAAGAAGGLLEPSRPHTAVVVALAPSAVGAGYAVRLPGGNNRGTTMAAVVSGLFMPLMQARLRHPRAVGVLGAAAAASAVAMRRERRRRDGEAREVVKISPDARLPVPAASMVLPAPGLAPLITSPADFYRVDVTFPAPRVDPEHWRLRVGGAVNAPLDLTLSALLSLGTTEIDSLLVCVHNPVGGHRMGNGRWTVVPLAVVLDQAGIPEDLVVDPASGELVAQSVDGFTVSMPLEVARDMALLAVGLGGRALPFSNGFPVRLLVPGRYGYAGNVKWLAGLDVRRTLPDGAGAPGYWTSRGWPANAGQVRAASRIDVPRAGTRLSPGRVPLAGYAWAPPGGVRGVEVSVDHGPWQRARMAYELSPLSWRPWTFDWEATAGAHVLRVRCTGVEADQDEHNAAPYPNGPSGVHSVAVRVGSTGRVARAAGTLAGTRHAFAARLRLAVDSGRAWL